MRKMLIAVLLFFSISSSLAQKAVEEFEITLPEEKIRGVLYDSLRLVDIREDTTDLGLVQTGAFNKKKWVKAKRPLSGQLNDVITSLADVDAQKGRLLLVIRKFSFAEVTGAFREKGYCQFRASLFVERQDGYSQLARIDTVITVGSMEVTRAMFRKGSQAITDFISASIIKPSIEGTLFSYPQVLAIDSMEKVNLAAYRTKVYKDGLYKTFDAFTRQEPDEQNLLIEFSQGGKIKGVKKETGKKNPKIILPKYVYAIVHDGKPYVATEFGYFPITRTKGDFYFTGKAKAPVNPGEVAMASFYFGIIGALMASSPAPIAFKMKIDHLSGGFIRLQEVMWAD